MNTYEDILATAKAFNCLASSGIMVLYCMSITETDKLAPVNILCSDGKPDTLSCQSSVP